MADPELELLGKFAAASDSREFASKLRALAADLRALAVDGVNQVALRSDRVAILAEGWANACDRICDLEIAGALQPHKRRPGYPKKVSLASLLPKDAIARKKRGRPPLLTSEESKILLQSFIRDEATLERDLDPRKLTDKGALALIVKRVGKKEHWSTAKQQKLVETLTKDISGWRTKFGRRLRTKSRKPPKNSR